VAVTPAILCSTGILTRDPEQTDHKAIVEHAGRLGAAGYELVLYEAWYGHLDEVIEDLRTSDLSFPVVHADKSIGAALGSEDADEADEALATLEVNCRAATALGAQTVVLHIWDLPAGDRLLERNLDRLPACLDTAEAYNMTLAVEAIPGIAGTPLANIRLALERDPRCRVTLDSEYLGFHGQLDESIAADWLWSDSQVRHVHLKDFDGRLRDGSGRRYLLPGEGVLDLQSFLGGLVDRRYTGAITLEGRAVTGSGELDEARLEQVAAVVKQLGGT
jgi:sugar phosphate isomerase/epimerase